MKKNRLLITVGALILLVGLTFWASKSEQTDSPEEATLPSIKKDKLDEIEIQRPQEKPIRLAKNGKQWRVVAPLSAEADQGAVDTAIEKLADLAVNGVAATKKSNHAVLEVDIDNGIRVIAKHAGKTLADLVIGAGRGGNTMVREHSKESVVSVAGSLRWMFNKELKDWRQRKVVDIDAQSVQSVEFRSPQGTFQFEKKDGPWATVKGKKAIPKFDETKVSTRVSSVATLMASGFAEEGITREAAGLGEAAKTTITLVSTDGDKESKVVVRIGNALRDDENRYYLEQVGNPILYTITKTLAQRLAPKAEDFQESEETEGAAAGAPPAGMPPGMPGMPGGMPGGGQLPPEVMQQLQQQLQNQQK